MIEEKYMNSYDMSKSQVEKRQKKLEKEHKKEIKIILKKETIKIEKELAREIEDYAIKNGTTNQKEIGLHFNIDPRKIPTLILAYRRITWDELKEKIAYRKQAIEEIKFEANMPKGEVFYTPAGKEYITYLVTNDGVIWKVNYNKRIFSEVKTSIMNGRKYFAVMGMNKTSVANLVYKHFVDNNIKKSTTIGFLDRNPNNLNYKNLFVEKKSKKDIVL